MVFSHVFQQYSKHSIRRHRTYLFMPFQSFSNTLLIAVVVRTRNRMFNAPTAVIIPPTTSGVRYPTKSWLKSVSTPMKKVMRFTQKVFELTKDFVSMRIRLTC